MTEDHLTTAEYLERVRPGVVFSGDMSVWLDNPEEEAAAWESLERGSACVFDFVATSSLLRTLVRSGDLSFRSNEKQALSRGTYIESDERLLHQLLFHDRVYLNLTTAAHTEIDLTPLQRMGFEVYPRPRLKSFFAVHRNLRPLFLAYLERLAAPLPDLPAMLRVECDVEAAGSKTEFLGRLYDEVVKDRIGELSFAMHVASLLELQFSVRVHDLVEEVVDGLTAMTNDQMSMMTLAPAAPGYSPPAAAHLRDDTVVLLQLALNDELGFTPRVDRFGDVMRLRETREVQRLRELFSELNRAIHMSEEAVLSELKREILSARTALKKWDVVNSRGFVWITTALGFVPVVAQILGIAKVVLYEASELTKRRNDWIYLGLK